MNIWLLAGLVFIFNVMTFGNGPVLLPLLQQAFVDERGVLSQDQLLYAFAIARVTPGQANVYVASVGYFLYGIFGAVLTTLAIQLPGYLMIPLLKGYERFKNVQWVKSFTKGLTITSVGLIFAAVIQISLKTLTNPVAWLVLLFTVAVSYWLKWNTFLSLGVACVLGLFLHIWF